MNCKLVANRKLLHELQVYIKADIECELTSLPDGRWFMPFARLMDMAADGLVQAVVAEWPLPPGHIWESKVLFVRRVNDVGWYRLEDVI